VFAARKNCADGSRIEVEVEVFTRVEISLCGTTWGAEAMAWER
jgi:hypothetical protein